MSQSRVSEQKYLKKNVALRKDATKNNNILNRKPGAAVKKLDSFKFDDSKYDVFGRVSKHIFKFQKMNEIRDSVVNGNEKKDLEHEDIIDSEKYELKNTSPLSESEVIKEMFGIDRFETSKNKNHSTSSLSYFNIKSKRKYRQYMNRPGGFNRPLSPTQ
ncbi:apicomplexan conserved motif [Cryptosporidium sp. chipmunk genotype I]|uniref:apicomplexan conserved motif n=1 Tax=Cryptosporidium sp. chipmunk genotype I TaxID=1280935 RepID=UPI00351A894C|nr:apicomplexan conserved motif [Cryptosporidium sp. chipmunk genotype I]